MGITKFFPYLKSKYFKDTLEGWKEIDLIPYLQQKSKMLKRPYVLGIDGYYLLHKYAFDDVIAEHLVLQPNVREEEYITKIVNFLNNFLNQGIKVFVVFDGKDMKSKKETEESRLALRINARNLGLWNQAVDISYIHASWIIERMHSNTDFRWITAPFEADAQLAWLSNNGLIDGVLLEDSDSFLYGCKEMFFKYKEGKCELWRNVINDDKRIAKHPWYKYFFPIILGCDYFLPNGIPGIGEKSVDKTINIIMSKLMFKSRFENYTEFAEFLTRVFFELQGKRKSGIADNEIERKRIKEKILNTIITYEHQLVFAIKYKDFNTNLFSEINLVPLHATNDYTLDQFYKFFGYNSTLNTKKIPIAVGTVDPSTGLKFNETDIVLEDEPETKEIEIK